MEQFPRRGKIEAIKICFHVGVSHDEDKRIKHRVGAGWLLQLAACESTDLKWETLVDVARGLEDESTTAEAELVAATEAVRAAVNLVRTGWIEFDLDGKRVDEGNQERRKGRK